MAESVRYWHPDYPDIQPDDVRRALAQYDGEQLYVFEEWADLVNLVRDSAGRRDAPDYNARFARPTLYVPRRETLSSSGEVSSSSNSEAEILTLGRVKVYTSVFHDSGFKRNKLKDAGRGGGKGSDLVVCDAEGNIEGLGLNIFQKAHEKASTDESFPGRLFAGDSYTRYLSWVRKNIRKEELKSEPPKKNPRDKPICPKCSKVVKQGENCKCGQLINWDGFK